MSIIYKFEETLKVFDGKGSWFYIHMPKDTFAEINEISQGAKRGFGSVRVEVTVGATTWRTSLFPDTSEGSYMLFMKKAVRTTEGLELDKPVLGSLRLVEI